MQRRRQQAPPAPPARLQAGAGGGSKGFMVHSTVGEWTDVPPLSGSGSVALQVAHARVRTATARVHALDPIGTAWMISYQECAHAPESVVSGCAARAPLMPKDPRWLRSACSLSLGHRSCKAAVVWERSRTAGCRMTPKWLHRRRRCAAPALPQPASATCLFNPAAFSAALHTCAQQAAQEHNSWPMPPQRSLQLHRTSCTHLHVGQRSCVWQGAHLFHLRLLEHSQPRGAAGQW